MRFLSRRTASGLFVALALAVANQSASIAQGKAMSEPSRENLMVVLRESIGANKQDETLVPTGKSKAKLPDGREIEIEFASFEFIGDMHIRVVFDGPQTMRIATPQELAQLRLSPEEALQLGVANVKRTYGDPVAKPWSDGLMQVQGKSPDLDSSYFLDRSFWQKLAKQYPEGIVVAVPKRGGLLYAPLADRKAVDALRKSIGSPFTSSDRLRVSSALYLFKDDKWSVFQPPQKP